MWERMADRAGWVVYRCLALRELGVDHAFTTRLGPGAAPWNWGLEDQQAELRRAAGARPDAQLVQLAQVHGADVVDADGPRGLDARGDALVSGRADRLLLVYAADCVPVLLASADGRRVAAVHAGWRGLVAGVLPAAVRALGVAPAAAAIGPCLSLAHCEMGPEVVERFDAAGLSAAVHRGYGARDHVDVRAAARLQLEAAGCREIWTSDRCTFADRDEFPSYRRDVTQGGAPKTSRMAALIAARG